MLLCSSGFALPAHAQTGVFYSPPNPQQYLEIKQYGQAYVSLTQTGVPAANASTFTFSTAAMNSPLFSPLRAARSAVGLATGLGECGTGGASTGVTTQAIALYLAEGKIETDLADTNATLAHLEAVISDPNATLTTNGALLVSEGLLPGGTVGIGGSATYAAYSGTTNWITTLTELAPGWAATRDYAQEHRKLLTGTATEAQRFLEQVSTWVNLQPNVEMTAYMVTANFGLYGAMPIVVGTYEDSADGGFILIDPFTGGVDGPFRAGSKIDAFNLLSAHSEYQGGDILIANATTGECEGFAKSWQPVPPPNSVPMPVRPRNPTTPIPGFPFPLDPTRPGWWSDYSCVTVGANCECETRGQNMVWGPPIEMIPVKRKCTTSGGCAPTTATPPAPPTMPFVVLPPAGWTCSNEYFW